MNKWMKKKQVSLAVMTLVIGLGVTAMAPISKGTEATESNKVTIDHSKIISLSLEKIVEKPIPLLANLNIAGDQKIEVLNTKSKKKKKATVEGEDKNIETSILSLNNNKKAVVSDDDTTDLLTKEEKPNKKKKEKPAPEFLTEGVEHSIIAELQQRLMDLGFMDYAEPTQYFGPMTKGAIMIFQRQHELKQDGIVGPETLATIMSPDCKNYTVFLGAQGDDVTRIQNRLYEMGYLATADTVTGYFGDVTEAAVKKMQEINSLTVDGRVGVQTLDLLYSDEIKPNFLSFGENNEIIEACQTRLKELGYLTTTPDGVYGNDTAIAVKQFQSRNDLVVDGYLGPTTLQRLNSSDANPNGLSLGDRNDNVTRVQELLSKYGYISESNATGYYGEITEEAVKAFQKNNGLTADGTVGMRTMVVLTSGDVKKASTESSGSSESSSSNSNNSSSSSNQNKNSSSNSESEKNNSGSSSSSGESSSSQGATSSSVSELIRVAKSKVGSPYVLGAKGPNAFDCSGFVYWCLNQIGVNQSYTTSYGWRSINKYSRVSSYSDLRAGDIVVVYGHVGIVAESGMVVDASSSSGQIVYRGLSDWWKSNFIVGWRIF